MQVMHLACNRSGFWNDLFAFHEPVFYHVAFELPEKVELKVRFSPEMEGLVCGILTKGMVVSCMAVLDKRWLQIRFGDVDSAWVLCQNSKGVQLLKRVHQTRQIQLLNTIKEHPSIVPMENLLPILDEGEEERDAKAFKKHVRALVLYGPGHEKTQEELKPPSAGGRPTSTGLKPMVGLRAASPEAILEDDDASL